MSDEARKGVLARLMAFPGARSAALRTAHFIDLQWTYIQNDLRAVAPRARGRLLDVGCGDKPYVSIFAPYVTEHIGVEHEATFATTHGSMRDAGPDVYYDGERLPFEDASFDTVLNVQVLEHTPSPQRLLDEMARVMKTDGVLILNAPFCFRLHEEPQDYFRYSPHGLRVMCEHAGLEIVEMRAQGSLWSVLGHKLNSYLGIKVARLDGVTQELGKFAHEGARDRKPRAWAAPIVVPTMGAVSIAARVLDRVLPDETEALSFLIVAKRKK